MAGQTQGVATYDKIWQIYHDLVLETLYPWDQHYLQNMPKRRTDDSIFVSMASYRDENCLSTIHNAYAKAKNPELLNIGLVQQNCVENCKSGILDAQFTIEVSKEFKRILGLSCPSQSLLRTLIPMMTVIVCFVNRRKADRTARPVEYVLCT